jgi:hypothetical protein
LTLDYPQIDEWLIKALAVTFAPFGQPEKPQVFPRPAASFIKNGPDISMLEAIGGRRCRERRRFWKGAGGTVMPVLIGILRRSDAARSREPFFRIGVRWAFAS